MITGAGPAKGRTTTALNLAASFALAGKRVILIEADLRRPKIGGALRVRATRGIASVLIDGLPLNEALLTTEAYGENLKLLLVDRAGEWMADQFSLPAAHNLVDEAKEMADIVIIDSPPLTEVIDALAARQMTDEVLIVVRLGRTHINKLTRLGELLGQYGIRPVGFALVGVSPTVRLLHGTTCADAGRAAGAAHRAHALVRDDGLAARTAGRRPARGLRPLWRPRRRSPDLPAAAWYLALALLAVLMGVVAGYNPKYAIAGAFGLAFVAVVLVDVTFGLCAFTFLSFLELLLVTEDKSVQLQGGRLPADGLVAGPHLDAQEQERELRRAAPAVHVHPGAVPDLGAVERVLGGIPGGRSTPPRATSRT